MRLERRKMQEREKRKITAILVLVAFMMTLFPTGVFAADVTTKLIDLDVAASQEGNSITDWGSIDIEKEIKLKFSFQVPVKGDDAYGPDIVHYGDTAKILIAEGLTLVGTTGPFELAYGGKTVGTLNITGDTTALYAEIDFDGYEDIFTSAIENWSDVKIDFTATLKYERDPSDIDGGTETIVVLGQTFTLTVPPLPYELEGEKTGERDGQFINWKVKIKEKNDRDLDGYEFRDDITTVGEYVPGTLKVHDSDDIANATLVTPDFSITDTSLTYTFLAGSTGEHFIYFQTKIKDDLFNSNGDKTITNQAKMFKGETEWWNDSDDVTFTIEWIKKTGAIHDFDPVTNTGKITWTIQSC